MEASSKIKTAFKEGKPAMGLWQTMPSANVSRILARAGVDWVMVDCEHGNIDGEADNHVRRAGELLLTKY